MWISMTTQFAMERMVSVYDIFSAKGNVKITMDNYVWKIEGKMGRFTENFDCSD